MVDFRVSSERRDAICEGEAFKDDDENWLLDYQDIEVKAGGERMLSGELYFQGFFSSSLAALHGQQLSVTCMVNLNAQISK